MNAQDARRNRQDINEEAGIIYDNILQLRWSQAKWKMSNWYKGQMSGQSYLLNKDIFFRCCRIN